MPGFCAAWLFVTFGMTPPSPWESPPGGYREDAALRGREPPDGERYILPGSILVPLGALSTAFSATSVWATSPDHCTRVLERLELSQEQCRGLFTLSIIRTVMGGLMLVSGTTLLAIGLHQRRRHERWLQGKARIVPMGSFTRNETMLGLAVFVRF